MRLAVAAVHAEEVAREERGLLAARPGTDLHHRGTRLEGIRRQQRREHVALGLLELALQHLELCGRLVLEIGIGEKLLIAADVARHLLVGGIGALELFEKSVVTKRRPVTLRVRQNIRVAQVRFHGRQTTQNILDLSCVDQAYFANFA